MCLAIPGRVISIAGDDPLLRSARVEFGSIVKEVSLVCVPDVQVGDYVLVHVGVALSVIDEKSARDIFTYLEQAGNGEGRDALH